MTRSVSSKSITSRAASKLTGNLPALNGAALSNIAAGVYFNASDPTISSNKSLGFLWANSTSGEMFMCTDATAGANVWTNVGSGSGNIPIPHRTIAGYASGGNSGSNLNTIDKFTFASDANATDHGDLTVARFQGTGQSSSTHGYHSGGSPAPQNTIDKFTFASNANATDVGDLTVSRWEGLAGQSSTTHGYTSGGFPTSNVIDRFSFVSDANATDVGDLTVSRYGPAGISSTTHGYTATGDGSNVIDKFAYASSVNATDVGDMTVSRHTGAGSQY